MGLTYPIVQAAALSAGYRYTAPQRATVECGPQLADTKAPAGGSHVQGALQETPIHLLRQQAVAKTDQGAFAEGRRVAVETIEHQLPAPIGSFRQFLHPQRTAL